MAATFKNIRNCRSLALAATSEPPEIQLPKRLAASELPAAFGPFPKQPRDAVCPNCWPGGFVAAIGAHCPEVHRAALARQVEWELGHHLGAVHSGLWHHEVSFPGDLGCLCRLVSRKNKIQKISCNHLKHVDSGFC